MPSLREQLRRARRRYLKARTNEHLRWYLKAKGRLSIWDPRMHLLTGSNTRVNRGTKQFIARGYAFGLVPSFTTEGKHAPGSYHYAVDGVGRAADLNSRPGASPDRERRFQLREFAAWQRGERPHMVELIGPDNNAVILKGQHSPLPEGSELEQQHDNHTHGAFLK